MTRLFFLGDLVRFLKKFPLAWWDLKSFCFRKLTCQSQSYSPPLWDELWWGQAKKSRLNLTINFDFCTCVLEFSISNRQLVTEIEWHEMSRRNSIRTDYFETNDSFKNCNEKWKMKEYWLESVWKRKEMNRNELRLDENR